MQVALGKIKLLCQVNYGNSKNGIANCKLFLFWQDCVFSLVPCSYSVSKEACNALLYTHILFFQITGNLILIAFYGVLLGIAAKLISGI